MSMIRPFLRAASVSLVLLAVFAGCGEESGDDTDGGEVPSFGAPMGNNTTTTGGTASDCSKISALGTSTGGEQSVTCSCVATTTPPLSYCDPKNLKSPCASTPTTCAKGTICRCSW